MNSIALLRVVGLIEGVTTALLFLVAMPMKYFFANPGLVPSVGMIHGLAFIAYIATVFVALRAGRWSGLEAARTFLAGLVPFATFFNDPFLKRKQAEAQKLNHPA